MYGRAWPGVNQSAVKWSSDDERWQPREMRGADRKRKLPRGQGLRCTKSLTQSYFLFLLYPLSKIVVSTSGKPSAGCCRCQQPELTELPGSARTTTDQVIVSLRSRPLDKAWFLTACHVFQLRLSCLGEPSRHVVIPQAVSVVDNSWGGGDMEVATFAKTLKTQQPFETKHWNNRVWMYSQK